MIDDEGMLTRGAVYLDLQPGMGYYSKIKAIPSEEKQLTQKHTLELLAKGEITTAHKLASPLGSYEEAAKHLSLASKLLEFRKNLV